MAQERNSNGQFMKVYRYKTRAEYEKSIESTIDSANRYIDGVNRVNNKLHQENEQTKEKLDWLYEHTPWFVRRKFDKLFK